jgi:drug/metabolite transporter (DMT)-like permease
MKDQDELPFEKINYQLFAGALVLAIIGYLLMSGGGSEDPTVFKYDELFAFRRITLAPLVILAAFGLAIYAILKKPKEQEPK